MLDDLHIVLIDDNPYDRELIIRELLRSAPGLRITEVADMEQWCALLEAGGFDAVITDYRFYWSDGLAILAMVKSRDPGCPVIMFTGTGTQELAVAAMKAGLDDYVIKSPRHYVRLPAALQGVLDRVRAQRRLAELESELSQLLVREQQARLVAEASQRRWRFLADASALLAFSLDYQATLQRVAQLVVPAMADWCGVYIVEPGQPIALLAVAHRDPSRVVLAYELQRRYPPTPDEPRGIGAVIRTGKPELSPSISEALLERAAYDAGHLALWHAIGIHSTMVVPLVARGRTLGAMSFVLSGGVRSYGEEDLQLASEIASRAAVAVDNARLFLAEQQAQQRLALLEAINSNLATSLEYDVSLKRLARQLVPVVADYCVVYVCEEDGRVRRLVCIHRDPAKEALLEEIERRYPFDPTADTPTAQVLRNGQPLLLPPAGGSSWTPPTLDPVYLELWHGLGTGWGMVVPLVARGRVLGALLFATEHPARRYSEEDLQLATEIASRAAVAVDNARLYRQVQQAVQARDQFLTIAAHELKTPLTSLLGNAQLLQRRASRQTTPGDPLQERAVWVIAEQARRLSDMIEQLLDVTRIQTGQLRLAPQPIDLAALIRQAIEEHQAVTTHRFVADLPEPSLLMLGDELRLQQVLQNLLSNAMKYSPNGGTITVRMAHDETSATLMVVDPGIGIPAEDLPHIFERFYRGRNAAEQYRSGMGIGLSVVYEIVALHGGTISAQSAEGAGSTFVVVLPLAGPTMAPGSPAAQLIRPGRVGRGP